MKTINLRDYYPLLYDEDCFMDVPDEIASAMDKAGREEHAYYERRRYHRAFYSLERDDGIESDAIHTPSSPEDEFVDKLLRGVLYSALISLPEKQRDRVYQHYILGRSKAEIARSEGVSEKNVRQAIDRGIHALFELVKKHL